MRQNETTLRYFYLVFLLFVVEIIYIHIAAIALCGIVEYGETSTHKEASEVELHSVWLSNLLPVLIVSAVTECSQVLMEVEVSIDAQVHHLRVDFHFSNLFLIDVGYLFRSVVHVNHSIGQIEVSLVVLLLQGHDGRMSVECAQAGYVTVFHFRDVHAYRTG